MRRSRDPGPALITSAHESGDEEFDRRRRRYAIMMSVRGLCVIGAATTYTVSIWLAMAFVAAGIVLPWCAVILANDRPAQRRVTRPDYRYDLRGERALPAPDDGRTVDG